MASSRLPPSDPAPTQGPVLGLLSRALELWLRQQCTGIERLEIQLQGSAGHLVMGRLEGVKLFAKRVVYRQLHFERVELASGPIRVRMGALLRGQSLQLEHPFQVRGRVSFSGQDLSTSLATAA